MAHCVRCVFGVCVCVGLGVCVCLCAFVCVYVCVCVCGCVCGCVCMCIVINRRRWCQTSHEGLKYAHIVAKSHTHTPSE